MFPFFFFFFERSHLYFKRLLNYIRDFGNRVVINVTRKRWVIRRRRHIRWITIDAGNMTGKHKGGVSAGKIGN